MPDARAFGVNVDFAQIKEDYVGVSGRRKSPRQRFSPSRCTGMKIKVISGDPDPADISTSFVERQNLTMRMGMRRFTWLTNRFSKKIENHAAAISLHFMHYNFGRPHHTPTTIPLPRQWQQGFPGIHGRLRRSPS